MRRALPLAISLVLTGAAARGEQPRGGQTVGQWRVIATPSARYSVAWVQARGTVTTPDFCRELMTGADIETRPPAEVAAIRKHRAACLMIACLPSRGTWPRRYELSLMLFGTSGPAEDDNRGPPLRAQITLRLDDGPLVLNVGLATPLPIVRLARGSLDVVLFSARPVERSAVERILRSRTARTSPINERFAAYIWVIPFTFGTYAFDLTGGAEVLARLDTHCR